MANKPIIDMEGLYRAGYNSRIDAENADKDRRVQLIDQLFIKAGSWVVDRYKQNHTALKGLKQLGRASNSQIQMEVEKLGGQLNPVMQKSLNLYKQEYDKGARMSVKGLTKKKKEEGQIMMDMAFHKMQTMKKGLIVVEEKMREQVDNGMIELGEKGFNNTAVTGWNSGATEAEFNNAVRLATGEMLGNLSIDDETGEIYYMEQAMADTSEEAYSEYVKENGGTQGTFDDYVAQMQSERREDEIIGEDEWNKQNEGIYTYEEWEGLNENNPQTEATLFSRIQFPGEEDNTLQDQYKAIRDKHEQRGEDGYLVDKDSTTKLQIELKDSYDNATDTQIRSFLFGGQISAVVDGELIRVTPAQKLLIDSGINPGKDGGTAVEQAEYFSFQQALEELKGEDFSKGSPRREELVGMITESVEGYQNNAHQKYLDKEEKSNAERNKGNQQNTSEVGAWPTGGSHRKKFGSRWLYPNEYEDEVVPTLNALNSTEENISEFTTYNSSGVAYNVKKENGQWYAYRGEEKGWVKSTRNDIARNNAMTNDLTDIDEVYKEDKGTTNERVELSGDQSVMLKKASTVYVPGASGYGGPANSKYFGDPDTRVEIPFDSNTHSFINLDHIPRIHRMKLGLGSYKKYGSIIAVDEKKYREIAELSYQVKNGNWIAMMRSMQTDFNNHQSNVKRALKGNKSSLENLSYLN